MKQALSSHAGSDEGRRLREAVGDALGVPSFMAALIGACLAWIPVYGMILPAFAALLAAVALRFRGERLPGFGLDTAMTGLAMAVIGLAAAAVWTALVLSGVE